MLGLIAILCLIGAVIVLFVLSVIDMRVRLLPNELVAGFATLGAVFHLTTMATQMPFDQILLGGIVGFSTMYLIRAAANAYYKQDALGLGDVKLLAAAGIWLGVEGILLALWVGALAGVVHGILYAFYVAWKDQTPVNLINLAIPAGPGFATGIVIVGGWIFHPFVIETIHGLFA